LGQGEALNQDMIFLWKKEILSPVRNILQVYKGSKISGYELGTGCHNIKTLWCDNIMNVCASIEDKPDDTKDNLYEEMDHPPHHFPA